MFHETIFTVRKRSCGMVMFYTCLSVILFAGGSASVHAGKHPLWTDTSLGRHPSPGQTPPRQTPPAQTPPPPQQTATAVNGTHPTGVLSCCKCEYVITIGDQRCLEGYGVFCFVRKHQHMWFVNRRTTRSTFFQRIFNPHTE